METTQTHVGRVAEAIRESLEHGPVAHEGNEILEGLSGGKLLGLLQRLPRLFESEEAAYLEVGVFQGLTLLSVAGANPGFACAGIDNFAYFDADGKNRGIVLDRKSRLKLDNVQLIDSDYEDALESLPSHVGERPVGVYFVDGPHDYRSQLMCLALILPHLHPRAVIVVDDSNYAHVRQANRDFLRTNPEFRLVFQAYTERHPGRMSDDEKARARAGWWNGVNVMVRDPEGILPYQEPPTIRDRTLYENDHLVHSARMAPLAPESVRFTDALLSGRLPTALHSLGSLLRGRRRIGGEMRGRTRSLNTYSEPLVGEHWNG